MTNKLTFLGAEEIVTRSDCFPISKWVTVQEHGAHRLWRKQIEFNAFREWRLAQEDTWDCNFSYLWSRQDMLGYRRTHRKSPQLTWGLQEKQGLYCTLVGLRRNKNAWSKYIRSPEGLKQESISSGSLFRINRTTELQSIYYWEASSVSHMYLLPQAPATLGGRWITEEFSNRAALAWRLLRSTI